MSRATVCGVIKHTISFFIRSLINNLVQKHIRSNNCSNVFGSLIIFIRCVYQLACMQHIQKFGFTFLASICVYISLVWVYISYISLGIHFLHQFRYTFLTSIWVNISFINLGKQFLHQFGYTFLTSVWVCIFHISLGIHFLHQFGYTFLT